MVQIVMSFNFLQSILPASRIRILKMRLKTASLLILASLPLFFVSCASVVDSGPSRNAKHPRIAEQTLQTLRLQIFLDSLNYGPGVLDGQLGFFTERAAHFYRRQTGKNLLATQVLKKELETIVPMPFALYQVSREDLKFVGPLPSEPAEQAKLQFLPYISVAELVAERYRTTPWFLQQLNPGTSLQDIQPGTVLWVPNVTPFKIEELRRLHKLPVNPALARNQVEVSLRERYLQVTSPEGRVLAYFPITPGSLNVRPPIGEWRILGIVTLPTFRWDDSLLQEGVRSDVAHLLPPGPNSPVGVLWAGINRPGIGIHGTNSPETIGRATSSGCIRLSNWDAITFSQLVSEGTQVKIRE